MAMSVPDPYSSSSSLQFWSGGPSPGNIHHFPGSGRAPSNNSTGNVALPTTRTLHPMVTGSSVIGLTFDKGVMLAADTLGSYGSLARFKNVSRMKKVTENCAIAASGDYADFQYMERLFEDLTIESDALNDGHSYTPTAIFSWLTRVMYNRRSKIKPLWNTVIVGGYHERTPLLGVVNSQGTAFEAPTLATGMGGYLAQPLLRDAYERNPNMNKVEARALLDKCMKVLFYRDCRTINKYEVTVISEDGVEVIGPINADDNWDIAHYVRGYD